MELEKSEHQMRQAAAAANEAERLQQVAEEKALLVMEYVRREGTPVWWRSILAGRDSQGLS